MIEVRLALILNIGQNMFVYKKRYYKVHFNSNIYNNKKQTQEHSKVKL